MKKTEVIKHSAAIQMTNRINLLQRSAWNILLAEAFDDLLIEDRHMVKLNDLAGALNFDSKNVQHLKDLLKGLMTTGVEWNVLVKDKKQVWEAYPLLGGAKIESGELTYEFPKGLREKLYNPSMYARINFSIQNKFTSKHSLALYEMSRDYFDSKRHQGESPWIELDAFRFMMGINSKEYKDFKSLNRRLIKEPVQEINESSDLYVEVEYRRQQRKVVAIKFRIKTNPNKKNLTDLGNEVVKELPAGPVNQVIYERLRKYFLFNNSQALETLSNYEEEYITEILDEIANRIKNEDIVLKNITAYTLKAIKEDWRSKKTQFQLDLEQKRESEIKAVEERQKEEEKKEKEYKKKRAHFDNFFSALNRTTQDSILKEAKKRLKKENPFFYERYQKTLSKGQSIDDVHTVKEVFVEIRNKILAERA